GVFAKELRNICHYYAPVNSDWISGMDCPGPAFAGNHNPGRYGRVFPSFGCFFSVFCWLDSSEKMLARSSFHRKGI
ncbi:hypothetical protein AB7533_29470, partial [Providencia rettgeri]